MVRPLIAIPSPREIPDFIEATAKIPCDKLWIKWHKEREAYRVMRKLFLSAKYDYLCILPDDLIATPNDYETLLKDVEEFDYPVLAGTCNLRYNDDRYITAKQVVNPWMMPAALYTKEELFSGERIKRVAFDGFAFTFIRKDVVKKIEFHSTRYMTTAFDNAFALECQNRGIPIHVDTSVRMLHLGARLGLGIQENWGVGIKKPTVVFEEYSK